MQFCPWLVTSRSCSLVLVFLLVSGGLLCGSALAAIAPQATVTVDQTRYLPGAPIIATFHNGVGQATDTLAIWRMEDSYLKKPLARLYVGGQTSPGAALVDGTVIFDSTHCSDIPPAGLAEGQYRLYFLTNDTQRYYQAGPACFQVSTCAPYDIRVATMVADTRPLAGLQGALVTVSLVDSCGLAVVGATLEARFSGAFIETVTGVSDTNGDVRLHSSASAASAVYECTVTAVTAAWPLNASDSALLQVSYNPQYIHEFIVSTTGDDSWPGTLTQPFASCSRAVQAIRETLAAATAGHVCVRLRGGTYRLDAPITLGPTESAQPGRRIIWEAFDHESVLLSGGRRITGWTLVAADPVNATWQVSLPEVAAGQWWFRELYLDNRRLVRARFPNSGYARLAEVLANRTKMSIDLPLPAGDLTGQQSEIIDFEPWGTAREIITQSQDDLLYTATPLGSGHIYMTPQTGDWAYLEHALQFLDQADEWYLNPTTGVLTAILSTGIDPNEAEVIAPWLDHLLISTGSSPENPIRNVTLRNLCLAHTRYQLAPEGYSEIQAGHFSDDFSTGILKVLPAAIELINAQGFQFQQCRLAHTAASGLALGPGCRHNIIDSCEFFDLGGNGVSIGWEGRDPVAIARDWAVLADAPVGNTVSNCHIHHVGQMFHGCVGIWAGFTRGTSLVNNEISRCPYSGISCGWQWRHVVQSMADLRIEHNHIHHAVNLLTDGGGIYILGTQPRGRIYANSVHHIYKNPVPRGFLCNGLYLDQGSDHCLLDQNLIYEVPSNPLHLNVHAGEASTDSCDHLWGSGNYFDRDPSYSHGVVCPVNAQLFDPLLPDATTATLLEQAGPGPGYRLWLDTFESLIHPVSKPQDNLLENPGFERSSDSIHPDWQSHNFKTNGLFPNPGSAYEGQQWASCSYSGLEGMSAEISQTVAVQPGHAYQLSSMGQAGGVTSQVQAGLHWWDGDYTGQPEAPLLGTLAWQPGQPAGGWALLSGIVIPASSLLSLIIRVGIRPGSGGFNLDDCRIRELPGTPTPVPAASPTPAGPADLSADGLVDQRDLLLLMQHWYRNETSLSADGLLDHDDLLLFLQDWHIHETSWSQ